MEDVAAPVDGLGPPVIAHQVGGGELEPVACVDARGRQISADPGLAGKVPDRRPHVVAALEQIGDAALSEEAGASADKYKVGHRSGLYAGGPSRPLEFG